MTLDLSKRRRSVALCAALVGTGVLLTSVGALADGTDPAPNPPAPDSSLLFGGERAAASVGDRAAAERLLHAGGWRPAGDSLRVVAVDEATTGSYALFSYRSASRRHLLAVGDADPLGGVHGSCREGDAPASLCGSAVQMDHDSGGHALVVGTAPAAQRVGIRSPNGSIHDAVLADGLWFARMPIDDPGASAPRSIVVWGDDGSIDRVPATELDAHIASTSSLAARRQGG